MLFHRMYIKIPIQKYLGFRSTANGLVVYEQKAFGATTVAFPISKTLNFHQTNQENTGRNSAFSYQRNVRSEQKARVVHLLKMPAQTLHTNLQEVAYSLQSLPSLLIWQDVDKPRLKVFRQLFHCEFFY